LVVVVATEIPAQQALFEVITVGAERGLPELWTWLL
jgi:hypothetical protein